MLPAEYNDWTLVSLSPLPLGWRLVLLGAVLVAVATVLWSYRSAKRRWLLIGLRSIAALLVAGFLIEPALQLRLVRRVKNRLAVIVDRSASMGLLAADGRPRYQHLLALIERSDDDLARLGEAHGIEWLDLDGPTSRAELGRPPTGPSTDLLSALERAKEAGAGRPLSALVLFSDGADNAKLEGQTPGSLSAEALTRLERLGAPVNTVAIADPEGFKDLAILEVLADEFAFVHNTLTLDVRVEASGLGRLSVPLTLRREGAVIATQEAVLGDAGPVTVRFSTKPDQIGSFVYEVSVPPVAGEAVTANNQRAFVLQVIRDKIRVLQVAGRPSWDERFLRQHLKENPNVDLISFFILRSPTDNPGAAETELALIPFPVDELFTTQLASFDVVIFQNFDHRPYQMAQYLPNIRAAVEGGLGFVMIGGDQSLANAGYVSTDIEAILPLAVHAGDLVTGTVTPVLTDSGRRHPITDLARGSGNNERLWQRLPAWTTLNRTAGLLPGATALVVDAAVRSLDGQPAPLISVIDTKQGRSLAISSDSMWRWRFAVARDGGAAERAYHRFWSNALHWLVRDPEHSRVRVVPEKRRFVLGEPVDVSFTVLGRDYQPVPAATLRVTVGRTSEGAVRTDDLTTNDTGVVRQRYLDLPSAAYRLSATATAGGESLGSGAAVFLVEPRSVELERASPRPDLLERIAAATGGEALGDGERIWSSLARVDPEVVEVDKRRNVELWDNVWALVAGVLLLALEWAMRRRSGYL